MNLSPKGGNSPRVLQACARTYFQSSGNNVVPKFNRTKAGYRDSVAAGFSQGKRLQFLSIRNGTHKNYNYKNNFFYKDLGCQ